MKIADPILEFIVVGAVCSTAMVSLFAPEIVAELELQNTSFLASEAQIQSLTVLLAVVGLFALPLLYFVGIISHHATWYWWRKRVHGWLLVRWAMSRPAPFAFVEREFRQSPYGRNCLGWDEMSFRKRVSVSLDWCRFKLLHSDESQLQGKFLQQWHLYRIAYGPITVVGIATLVSGLYRFFWPGANPDWYPCWSLFAVFSGVVIACWLTAAERARLMWKYLYYFATLSCKRPGSEDVGVYPPMEG